jgi:sRNA-binding carbon storage regulator CsrA
MLVLKRPIGSAIVIDGGRLRIVTEATFPGRARFCLIKPGSIISQTLRVGQIWQLAEDISFTLVRIQGRAPRIGVTAPKDVLVDREEVSFARQKATACNG